MPAKKRWRLAYERVIVWNVTFGGLGMGLAVIALSPAGLDAGDVVGWLALGVGAAAGCSLCLGQVRPVPFLVAITALVGAVAPIVDVGLAMALNMIVVSVLATGALLVRSVRRFWLLAAVASLAMTVRPMLEVLGWESSLALNPSPALLWVVATTALVTTALSFRGLRDELIRKDLHQVEMNRLISSLAHHLRTPLTGVIGFGHLICAEVLTDSGTEYASRIVSHGWELSSSLDDLIIAARSDAEGLDMRRVPVDLRSMTDQVLASMPGAAGKLSYRSVTGVAVGDPARIKQVLGHLVSNAVVHGGPTMAVYSRIWGGSVSVFVSDDGPPLSAVELERAFEPFYTESAVAESLHRGIGLTVSRVLARAMGGEVELVADLAGTTASLHLPADPKRSVMGEATGHLTRLRRSAVWRARPQYPIPLAFSRPRGRAAEHLSLDHDQLL
ncbi:MAG TPA: HAMP domain-containing sensor histidine kinase [Acidimicrobiia bacterium]|nr:HAMP domain-containing sensor histidine kinase [Acidimicrobiia bacterium]